MEKRIPNTTCRATSCDKEFYQRPNKKEAGTGGFCSRECYRTTTVKSVIECLTCKEQFRRRKPSQKYCSHNCSNTARKGIRYDGTAVKDRAHNGSKNYNMLCDRDGEKCSEPTCSVSTEWNNKIIRLHVDHIDGVHANNDPANLRLLCPNCHSQTPTYGAKNQAYQKQRM